MNKQLTLINLPASIEAGILFAFPHAKSIQLDSLSIIEYVYQSTNQEIIVLSHAQTASSLAVLHELVEIKEISTRAKLIFIAEVALAPLQHLLSIRSHTPLFLASHFDASILRHYLDDIPWTPEQKHNLWLNEVDLLLGMFHIEGTYEAYPMWKEILLRSEEEFTPSISVYEGMLNVIVREHNSSTTRAERSLRHMIGLMWRHPVTQEWMELIDFNLAKTHRRPSITSFYRACFYYLRRRMEQFSLK